MIGKRWPVWDISFSPDGRWLAAGRGYRGNTSSPPWGGEGEVSVWRVDGWKQQAAFQAPFTYWANAVAFTADGKKLAAASDKYIRDAVGDPWGGNVVFVWTVPDGKLIQTLNYNDFRDIPNRGAGSVNSMALSPDGELIGLPRVGSVSVVLQRKTNQCAYELKENTGNHHSLAFSPDGKTLVSALKLAVQLCNAATGKELARFDLKNEEPTGVHFSPDGKQIAVGTSGGSVRLLTADLAKQLRSIELSDEKEKVVAMAFAARADLLAAATRRGVHLFDLHSGKLIRGWSKTELEVRAITLSPDGKLLAAGYGAQHDADSEIRSGFVNVWDTATGRLVKKLD